MNSKSEINALVDHLFRRESGKMISVLTKVFGFANLDLVEDVVQDSLVEAIKIWTYEGVPNDPAAWLYRVAKNKALNIVNREKYKQKYSSEILRSNKKIPDLPLSFNHIFSEEEIADDQLSMMFTCCHPAISSDSQVALTLKTLCGFSRQEIAKAFLTTEENINKRLVRARKKIRDNKIPFEVPVGSELNNRLQTVLETIYLLFNEGYNASVGPELIRYEVCEEAIRLAEIIIEHSTIQTNSDIYALLALMQLNASRFKSRQDADGNIITLEYQDRTAWDYTIMEKGFTNLKNSTDSGHISLYHILATISAYHCSASSMANTDWESILVLYDRLMQIDSSPIVRLNRAIAISHIGRTKDALRELASIESIPFIKSYYLFYSIKAEFFIELGHKADAVSMLRKAIELTSLESEKALLRKKIEKCTKN